MITVKVEEDFKTGDRLVYARVPRNDLVEVQLDPLDRMVVDSPEKSAADIFQTLEILARRIEEQQPSNTTGKE